MLIMRIIELAKGAIDVFKSWSVPIVGLPALAVTASPNAVIRMVEDHASTATDKLALVKTLLQIVLILSTILFTVYQGLRARGQWKRDKSLEALVKEAQHECPKAMEGNCPLSKRLP